VKRKGKLSAKITCNKFNITYFLEGEGRGQNFSPDQIQQIQHHLLPWKVKGKGKLSAQITCNKCNITYFLEGEEKGQIVSPDHMQQIQHYLLPGK
jgi:hypothetical protein